MPRALHRLMTPLALGAVLLLATVPTLGRMAAAAPAPVAVASGTVPAALQATHDVAGMSHGDMSHGGMSHGGMSDAGRPAMPQRAGVAMPHAATHGAAPAMPARETGAPHAGHAPDCDYCPLLQSLLGARAVAPATTPAIELPRPRFDSASAVLPWRHPSGLGSRGPPHAS